MAAMQSRIDKAGIRKVYSDTTIAPPTEQTTDTGHNSALFYELAEKNAELQHIFVIIDIFADQYKFKFLCKAADVIQSYLTGFIYA
jgi:hypothetical protein